MLSQRNLSPQQLSALTALLLSIPIALGIFFFTKSWWIFLIAFLVIFIGSFALILYTLQKFIYRKIKLIYKLISHTRASRKETFYYNNLLPQKSIDEVRQDVEQWAAERNEEVALLQRNEAFRREFLQNLSHELKTPIFAIQGYIDTLISGAMYNSEVNMKFLQNAARNAHRLVNLVGDLDEISKLESGEFTLNLRNFIIQDLIEESFETLAMKAAERQINCFIRKECEQPITVFADKERIRQVLINLTDNAIKYGKEGGLVEASIYKLEDKKVLIEISDNGSGISEDQLPRVFERFYRTELARNRKYGGSGLGLSICKHIIEAHDQVIHVRSTPGIGTSFGFMLQGKEGHN